MEITGDCCMADKCSSHLISLFRDKVGCRIKREINNFIIEEMPVNGADTGFFPLH